MAFRFRRTFLTGDEQIALLAAIMALPYAHDRFRGQELKRAYAQFGYAYTSTGRRLAPVGPFPDFLTTLAQTAMAFCSPNTVFNQCIVTHYRAGAGIGWHTDAPPFGDCIIAMSLHGQARLQFRPTGTAKQSAEVLVAPGALYVMQGPSRWNYQHQIVPVKTDRYSLTFRHVADGTSNT